MAGSIFKEKFEKEGSWIFLGSRTVPDMSGTKVVQGHFFSVAGGGRVETRRLQTQQLENAG